MTFPLNPTNNQTYTNVNGTIYLWDALRKAWRVIGGGGGGGGGGVPTNVYLLDGSRPLAGDMDANQYRVNELGNVNASTADLVTGTQPEISGFKLPGGSF